jgi:hypothetical protein
MLAVSAETNVVFEAAPPQAPMSQKAQWPTSRNLRPLRALPKRQLTPSARMMPLACFPTCFSSIGDGTSVNSRLFSTSANRPLAMAIPRALSASSLLPRRQRRRQPGTGTPPARMDQRQLMNSSPLPKGLYSSAQRLYQRCRTILLQHILIYGQHRHCEQHAVTTFSMP